MVKSRNEKECRRFVSERTQSKSKAQVRAVQLEENLLATLPRDSTIAEQEKRVRDSVERLTQKVIIQLTCFVHVNKAVPLQKTIQGVSLSSFIHTVTGVLTLIRRTARARQSAN